MGIGCRRSGCSRWLSRGRCKLSEDGTHVLDGFELVAGALVGGVADCVSEDVEAMKQLILRHDGGYGHCGVPESCGCLI